MRTARDSMSASRARCARRSRRASAPPISPRRASGRSAPARWARRSSRRYDSRMNAGRPIVARRAEPADAAAIHQTFLGPDAVAGTPQLPYPSVEMWRRRIADVAQDGDVLVATIDDEVVGNARARAAARRV